MAAAFHVDASRRGGAVGVEVGGERHRVEGLTRRGRHLHRPVVGKDVAVA